MLIAVVPAADAPTRAAVAAFVAERRMESARGSPPSSTACEATLRKASVSCAATWSSVRRAALAALAALALACSVSTSPLPPPPPPPPPPVFSFLDFGLPSASASSASTSASAGM